MKQLIDVPLKVRSIHSLGKKAKGKAQEDKRIKVVMTNDLTGATHLGQFFPHPDRFVKFGELHWDDEGGLAFDVGRIPLGYEITGGHTSFAYPPLWKDERLEYELVDVKRVFITPKEGRVCTVALIAIVEPGNGEVEKLYDVVGREVLFSAQWAESDVARAEANGQRSMPLPAGEGPAAEEDRAPTQEEAEKQVAAALGTDAASKDMPKDPFAGVPGQKPPQRPKRTGLPSTTGAH